jgi:hypothetical protein
MTGPTVNVQFFPAEYFLGLLERTEVVVPPVELEDCIRCKMARIDS